MIPGYFIAPDAHDDRWIWREAGNYPTPVLAKSMLSDDPDVWDILAANIREVTR